MEVLSATVIPASERRASRRFPPRRNVQIECRQGTLGLGPNLAVQLLDLSETGMRLTLRGELRSGLDTEVLLELASWRRPLKRLAAVVWCQPAGTGRWSAGLRFETPLAYADYQALIASVTLTG